jgi:hypothetical protein
MSSIQCDGLAATLARFNLNVQTTMSSPADASFVFHTLLSLSQSSPLAAVLDQAEPYDVENLAATDSRWRSALQSASVNAAQQKVLAAGAANGGSDSATSSLLEVMRRVPAVKSAFILDTAGVVLAATVDIPEQYSYQGADFMASINCNGVYVRRPADVDGFWQIALPVIRTHTTTTAAAAADSASVIGAVVYTVVAPRVPCVTPFTRARMVEIIQQSTRLSARTRDFAIDQLVPFSFDKTLATLCTTQNNIGTSAFRVQELDRDWINTPVSAPSPFQQRLLLNAASVLIRDYTREMGVALEVFAMANQGELVGLNKLTSDYWQGDEAKWKNSFNQCAGGLDVSDADFDGSTRSTLTQISFPVVDPGLEVVVGAVTWGVVELFIPCVKTAVSTSDLAVLLSAPAAAQQIAVPGSLAVLQRFLSPQEAGYRQAILRMLADSNLVTTSLEEIYDRQLKFANEKILLIEGEVTISGDPGLAALKRAFGPQVIGNIVVMNRLGVIAGYSDFPTAYYLAPQDVFKSALNDCNGGVFIAPPQLSSGDSGGGTDTPSVQTQSISLSLSDDKSRIIGVVQFEFRPDTSVSSSDGSNHTALIVGCAIAGAVLLCLLLWRVLGRSSARCGKKQDAASESKAAGEAAAAAATTEQSAAAVATGKGDRGQPASAAVKYQADTDMDQTDTDTDTLLDSFSSV